MVQVSRANERKRILDFELLVECSGIIRHGWLNIIGNCKTVKNFFQWVWEASSAQLVNKIIGEKKN